MSLLDATAASASTAAVLAERYRHVRSRSTALAAPLSAEDATVQSMPDASPSKWHLAHTTWFFEQFVLATQPGYRVVDERWGLLFNSYYQSVGPIHARPHRGLLTRPTLDEVRAFRDEIDARMQRAFERGGFDELTLHTIEIGLHHEQQHQELLLTDIKHAFAHNPLRPAYRDDLVHMRARATPLDWQRYDEAVVEIGAPHWPGGAQFAYDNESPRHRMLSLPFALANRPVTNAEYRQFIDEGGYTTVSLWLSAAWARIQDERWTRPLYWDEDLEREFTLGGMRELDPHAPVSHLSYYEADAFARWAGARLPTEFEWERAAGSRVPSPADNFVERDALHPQGATGAGDGLQQLYGDVWEWTSSAYTAYPGFKPWPGSLGEYNGKFMCGQWVLRGGSCASARDHLRASYRTFFFPPDRWQFSGLRLAKDLA
ncbi:ergothioneine biosynthesis protein EgtB [Lysobacter korlensis]|uniref:Ergothioneine biosynthesis protein EgtB n=1 Tax=Lysobacter korlensis TaxID=553636 RepID=A0ABV6RIL8_9GAMM